MSALVEIKDVCKVYNPGENEVRALDHVSLTIDEQEFRISEIRRSDLSFRALI